MVEWRLTDAEWDRLGPCLVVVRESDSRRGKPRLDNDRAVAEACLYRHFHSMAKLYRCFGWNNLPKTLGVSPSTANRRFREWTSSGAWLEFWDGLMDLRNATRQRSTDRATGRQRATRLRRGVLDPNMPVSALLSELERAYAFFNERFFGGSLVQHVAIAFERPPRPGVQGYFCGRQWNKGSRTLGHLAICTSALDGGADGTLETLLHEMVHLRNDQVGIADCTSVNQYHNRHFRDVALLAGLECGERHPNRGYAETWLSKRGRQAIKDFGPHRRLFQWSVGGTVRLS